MLGRPSDGNPSATATGGIPAEYTGIVTDHRGPRTHSTLPGPLLTYSILLLIDGVRDAEGSMLLRGPQDFSSLCFLIYNQVHMLAQCAEAINTCHKHQLGCQYASHGPQ